MNRCVLGILTLDYLVDSEVKQSTLSSGCLVWVQHSDQVEAEEGSRAKTLFPGWQSFGCESHLQ